MYYLANLIERYLLPKFRNICRKIAKYISDISLAFKEVLMFTDESFSIHSNLQYRIKKTFHKSWLKFERIIKQRYSNIIELRYNKLSIILNSSVFKNTNEIVKFSSV